MSRAFWIAFFLALTITSPVRAAEADWKKIDTLLGRPPTQIGDVRRYAFPRSDLTVSIDGVVIKPALALGGWVAFAGSAQKSTVMGDLVLVDTEVSPAISRLLDGGVEITALHNHLIRASPPTYYLHIAASGDAEKLAETIRAALALTKTPLGASPLPSPTALELDVEKIDEIIGASGRANSGVYQFSVPRKDNSSHDGTALAGAMGAANVINFQPTEVRARRRLREIFWRARMRSIRSSAPCARKAWKSRRFTITCFARSRVSFSFTSGRTTIRLRSPRP